MRGVYDELVRVPLVIRLPGRERPVARVSALTQTVDILPTVFDLFAIPYARETVQGHSLLPILTGEAERVRDYLYATCRGPHRSYLVRDHFWSLILYEGGALRALYDLASDPSQTRNVVTQRPGQADAMIAAFRGFAGTQRLSPLNFVDPDARAEPLPPARDVELSDETRRQLKALGYID
jgi:arylsulfatase/uncharacterized sulfatase